MNVLHISESDAGGGAGKTARSLHEGLRRSGVDSRMLVGRKLGDDGDVRSIKRNPAWRAVDRAAGEVADRVGLQYVFYPSSFGVLRDPWFRGCDIVQMHNLHGSFFSFTALRMLARRRPMVWWMQDMWPVTGHVAYSLECERWLTGCGSCPHLRDYPPLSRDTSALLWKLKRRVYRGIRPTMVVSSRWLESIVTRSPLVSHFGLRRIPNGVDLDRFSPAGREEARRELGLEPDDRTLLVFDGEPRKGALLPAILGALAARGLELSVIVMGDRGPWTMPSGLRELRIGRITDEQVLASMYAAADVFLFPTLADNLPNAILESLACGTPVVASDVGGVPDAVDHGRNGMLAPVGDVHAFADAVAQLLEDPERRLDRVGRSPHDRGEPVRRGRADAAVRGPLRGADGMRVLVAGGTGFVGSHVVEALAQAGHDVRSFARRPTAAPLAGIEYVIGDLGNVGDVETCMSGVEAAIFAATTTTPGSAARDAAFDASTNVINGVHFAHAASNAGVMRTIMVSSGGTVYGTPAALPIREDSPTEPISTYGVSKLAIEKYLAAYALDAGGRTTILRAGNAYGERQLPGTGQGAPAAFIAALLEDKPIEVWGDGSIVRDYVYAGDIGLACVAAVEADQPETCLVANVGSGEGVSLLDLAALCGEAVGREPRFVFGESRPFDVPSIVLDISRARERLGWTPTVRIGEGLRREAAWLEETLGVAVPGDLGWRP